MTKNIVVFPDQRSVEEEAAQWIALLDRGESSAAQQEALRAWVNTSPAHAQCLRKLARLWGRMDCLETLARVIPQQPDPVDRRERRWLPATVAALLSVTVTGFLLVAVLQQSAWQGGSLIAEADREAVEPDELVYRTEKGQQSRIELKDGSSLVLNTGSEVRIRFAPENREVFLVGGEAHFDVFSDADRPFIVYAGTGWVRALGTAFSVRVDDEEVEVLVAEGIVEVVPDKAVDKEGSGDMKSTRKRVLEAGSSARFNRVITESTELPVAHIERRLAWRQGKWMFEGETLAEVMAEVERYSSYQVVLSDPFLSSVRVGGYFDIGDVDQLMKALEGGFGIRVIRKEDTYFLYPAEG